MSRKEIINPFGARYDRLTFRPGVRKGNLLFLSGHAGTDPTTGKVVEGDVAAQTRQAFEKIKTVLAAAGASFDDVVKTVDYLTPAGLENYRATGAVRREYFKDSFPVSTGIIVNELLRKELNIEIDIWAVTGKSKKEIINPGLSRYQKLTYWPGIRKGDLLVLSGQGSLSYSTNGSTGNFVGKGDIVAQTRQIYENTKVVLEAAGASFDDVVKTVYYIRPTGLRDYPGIADVHREYCKDGFPARTTVVINDLLLEDMLIEIDIIAVTGKSKKEIVNPGWPGYDKLTNSPAVKKGNLIFVSGQAGIDPSTNEIVKKGDVVGQTRQAFENIKAILEAAGGSMDDVVKTIDFLSPAGLRDYRDTAEIRREYLKDGFPAGTGVIVNRLLPEDALIEIDVIAVID